MSTQNWRPSDLLSVDAREYVLFDIKGHDKKVKMHKSVLIENSSFFRNFFEGSHTNHDQLGKFLVDDDTGYELPESFNLFVDAVYLKTVLPLIVGIKHNWEKITTIYQVYYFADKFGVDWLIENCKKQSGELIDSMCLTKIPLSVIKALYRDLGKMDRDVDRFKKNIKWHFNMTDLVKAFEFANEIESVSLRDQVVTFCCYIVFDPSWPEKLIRHYIKRLREVASGI